MGITDGAKKVAGATVAGTKAAGKAVVAGGAATVVGYWRGLTYPFRGLRLVFFERPGLVRFWMFPILITLLLLSMTFWAGLQSYEAVTDLVFRDPAALADGPAELIKQFPPTEVEKEKPPQFSKPLAGGGLWAGVGHWLHAALAILVLLLIWSLGLLAVVFSTNVIAAPFNDLLSEEVERIRTGKEGPPFSLAVVLRDTVRTVGIELVKLLAYLAVMVPLWLLSWLLPGVGQVIYTIFAFLFTAIYFAVDYVDWPASRRNRSIAYRFGMLRGHFMPMLGFGTGVWLFLFIPFVNLLFMPAAVAGGTLLFLDLEGATADEEAREPA